VPEFPPLAHVAVTVTDLERSTRWYSELLAAGPVLDEDEQAGGFHHTVFALGGGQLLGLHTIPRPPVTGSTSIVPAWIMLPSPAVTAVSCRPGPRAWMSWASRTAGSRTPATALESPSAIQTA
jgi:catechol 2,3-dioxygenase-like lactoylglutathione lyase family enzyme